MNTSKERMELLLSYLQINGNELAASLGYKRSDRVYHVLRERNGISGSLARDICEIYHNISYQWLITGEGSMLTEYTIVPESKDIPYEMDEMEAMKQTINELLEEKKLLKNENKTLHDTNARLSISIERLTELLYEKTAKHA